LTEGIVQVFLKFRT